MEQGASGAAAGAAAASVAAGESSARFRGWVGEDSGQRTERTGPLTREQLWKLVDAVAVPGGVEREDGDIRAPAARFAAAVFGGGRGSGGIGSTPVMPVVDLGLCKIGGTCCK